MLIYLNRRIASDKEFIRSVTCIRLYLIIHFFQKKIIIVIAISKCPDLVINLTIPNEHVLDS